MNIKALRVIKLGKINEGYYGVYRLKWNEYKSIINHTGR
jgi:hypothetical protein